MKKVIALLCIIGIASILIYKITNALFRDKVDSMMEYDTIEMKQFLASLKTGDLIAFMNRENARFLQYKLTSLVQGTPYIHLGIVVKALDGTPYILHMQLLNGKQYKLHSPNINKNTGGIYLENLENCLKLYIKRYKSLFGVFRVKEKSSYIFKAKKIFNIALGIRNIKFMSNKEIVYHYVLRNILMQNIKDSRRNRAQCNILIGYILEQLDIIKPAEDIYVTYAPDKMDAIIESCGAYNAMQQIKII